MSKSRTHGSIWHRLRRGMSGILCLALLVGLLPAGIILPAQAADSWATPYAQQLMDWGVMRGDISGNLNLDAAITRAEFVTMVNRAYGYNNLGPTPFIDVSPKDWYYEDIGIAYNIGYFKGTSANTASPKGTLTREQAAVLLSRNLMLEETVGETLGFSDSRTLGDWSRGLIGAAVAEGMISGYSDGSFQPRRNISRGEVAAMLVRAIGTPISEEGDYTLGSVYGNVTVNSPGVKLRDSVILGNLYLTGGIDLGDVLLENVNVLGRIVISGAGESNSSQSSVILRNVEAKELLVDSIENQFVTIRAEGTTDIPTTNIRTNAYVDDSSWPGYGLSLINLDGEAGTKLQLAGNIKEVVNKTPSSDLQFVQGSAEKVTIDEYATNSTVLVDTNTRVDELDLDVATQVTGNGDIENLNVGAAGSNVAILPDKIEIRPGITATIDGTEMNSTTAAESSADPKLLAGYPSVKNIAPTTATGVFSTNKAGTVYWAISPVADGSVKEEDLIENPVYGGNIYEKQAGSINAASSNKEYTAAISKLLPDGSYYISAIMVDGRGNRSPLKVAAFTTPDNTVPAFNTGYPVMTKNTTQTAQVTVMTNKSCQLYYALLPGGSKAPTAQEFKANSISGNLGYGTVDAVKNVTLPIKVNRVPLLEKTTYDLYLWLTDYNGANSSKVVKLTFTTPDETPPIVTGLEQTGATANSAQVTYTLNEPGTLYWAIVTESVYEDGSFMPYDLDSLEARVKVEAGTGAIAKGSSSASKADTDVKFTISKLDPKTTGTTSYVLYYVAKDKDGNYSIVGTKPIRTTDSEDPTVTQHFTDTQDPKNDTKDPFADTDIQLVFSENVQGGTKGDKVFLNLYNDVLDAVNANNPSAIANARNILAAALREHISLWCAPGNAPDYEVDERTSDTQTGKWTIDWRYAEVEMNDKGQMVLTLPTVSPEPDKDSRMSALSLDSGATYYFKLRNIYDLAYGTARPMGAVDLEPFTTVYAQVTLSSENLSEIKAADLKDPTDPRVKDGSLRLDLCMSVTPNSTSKVVDSINWDLILWSNTSVNALIYRQVDNGKWELLNGSRSAGTGGPDPVEITVSSTITRPGISLYGDVMYQTGQPQFPYLNNPAYEVGTDPIGGYMTEGHTYRYGIHFTKVGDLSESSYDSWSQLVRMEAAVVAGAATDLSVVAGNVNANYDNKTNGGGVKSIGTATRPAETPDVLRLEHQFTDREVPKFTVASPRFTAGSSTIHMELNLDRPGTVYYVVAPVDSIPTTVTAGGTLTEIDKDNDGTADSAAESVEPTDGVTYIPVSGTDRENYGEYIAYMGENPGYSNPTYSQVINPRFNNSKVKSGTAYYDGSTLEIDVSGLEPSKDLDDNGIIDTAEEKSVYYIYFVFQGGGQKYSAVQCYRVTMNKVQVPTVTVQSESPDASMYTDQDQVYLSYALVEYNHLPSWIKTSEFKLDANKLPDGVNENELPEGLTVLDAMTTIPRGSGGKPWFDFASDTVQNKVMRYILGDTQEDYAHEPENRWKEVVLDKSDPETNGVETGKFNDYMADELEYVALATARHFYGGTESNSYGFGAVRGLYKEDPIPPAYDGPTIIQASITKVTKADGKTEVDDWFNEANPSYRYSGTVTVSFDKNVYQLIGNERKAVWAVQANYDFGDNKDAVSVISAMGGSAKFTVAAKNRAEGPTKSFTLTFTDLIMGEEITFFGSGRIGNASSYGTSAQLKLTFDPSLKKENYGGGLAADNFTNWYIPGFTVTWK